MDLQSSVFRWAAGQPGLTGMSIFAAGLVYAFLGLRMFPALMAISNAVLGSVLGLIGALMLGLPVSPVAGLGAIVGGSLSFAVPKPATAFGNGLSWALIALYLCAQVGFGGWVSLISTVFFGLAGAILSALCPRTMRVVLMTLQGSVFLVLGFVILSSNAFPSMGNTFRSLASDWSLMVPVLLAMVFVMAYSTQSMLLRGDMRTGVAS